MAALLMSEVLPSPWALSTKHREGGRASLKSLDDGALAGLVQKDPADMVAPLATRGWFQLRHQGRVSGAPSARHR